MSTTNAISGYGASAQTGQMKPLDRDAFLKLLITQLQNQDPMNPMQDKEFISQLAQFSSLEQMQSMNKSLEAFIQSQTLFSSLGLVGRDITWIDLETSNVMSGKVESVTFSDGTAVLKVGEKDVPIAFVKSVA